MGAERIMRLRLRLPARRRRTASVVVAALVGLAPAACAQGEGPTYRISEPSFHSAGPGAAEEIQTVLDVQADNIVLGDWPALLAMFIPTERSRCPIDRFAEIADQNYGELRARAQGTGIAARVADVQVAGFRATVDYQFVLPMQGLASPATKGNFLKLGDRWFIDEKAC